MVSDPRVGTVIEDKYRLDEQIGQGSMGAVFRGTQLMVDRAVAIKLLHPNFAGHDKIQARFEVEAKAIARLNHPNCITLFDFGYAEGMEAFYTVVEFIDGQPLNTLIDERPSEARVVAIMKQIASALGHAHHHGILHRDLKPENIMLASMTDGSEMVKVLDFGIAQIMQGADDEFESDRLTRVGEVFGTPPYMSPEQAQSARDLTPATDLYSLGIIFYELLTGRLPFFGDSPIEIMTKHREEPPPPMDDIQVSAAVEAVVMQMLAKDPEERPESGDRIVAMLNAIPDDELSTDSRPLARVAGHSSSGETLMSSPPEPGDHRSTRISVDDASIRDTDHDRPVDHEAPVEKSAILELTDIVSPGAGTSPDPDASPTDEPSPPTAAPADTATMERATPTTEDREAMTATMMVDPDEEEALARDASALRWAQRRSTLAIALVALASIGVMAWVFVTFEPFSMTDEERVTGAGKLADYDPSSSGPTDSPPPADQADDDLDEDLDEDTDDQADEPLPRQVSVHDEDEDGADEDLGDEDADEDEADESSDSEAPTDGDDEDPQEPASETAPPPPEPEPEPTPQEPAPQEPDSSDEDPDSPPRLDLF